MMKISNKNLNKQDQPVILDDKIDSVLKYQKPVLISYGDVRDITLGPSPGFGESGAGMFTLQP